MKYIPLSKYKYFIEDKTNDPAAIESEKKSNRRYPMTKTKAAIEELEALGAIEIVSKRPKQHVITIL